MHSELLSPSASGVWIYCTAMPGEKKAKGIESQSSVASERGTLQHYYAEKLDTKQIKPEDFEQYTSKQPTKTNLTIEEWTDVRTSVWAMGKLFEQYPSTKFKDYHELKVSFNDWRKDCFGTLDRGRLDLTNRTLFVLDHKFGFGVVPAKNNSQLFIYALALLELLRTRMPNIDDMIDTIVIGISQPRIRPEVEIDTLTLDELKQWDRDVLQPAQKAVLDGTGKFRPGSYCKDKYCPVRHDCYALVGEGTQAMDDFMSEFHTDDTDRTLDLIKDVSDEGLQDRLDLIPVVETIIDMLRNEAEVRIREGKNLERYKIVEGNGKNVWLGTEEEVVKGLKSLKLKAAEIHKKVLITPAQTRDLLKEQARLDDSTANKLADLCDYKPGSEKLVLADAKGVPLVFGPSSELEMDDLLADILGGDTLDDLEFTTTTEEEDFSDLFDEL